MTKHFAAGLAAFLIWGFFALPLRALAGYPAGSILYFRIVFSVVVLGVVIVGLRRQQWWRDWATLRGLSAERRRQVVWLVLAGAVLLTINWLTFIYIVNNINIKTASFSYFVCPVLTAVLGSVLLQEKLNRLQWLAVGVCALSCVLIGLGSALELGFSFLTAITYALYLISQRKNQGFDRIVILAIQVSVSLVVLSVVANQLVATVPTEPRFYFFIGIVAVFFTVLPLFLNLYALNGVSAATIGIVMYVNPLINFVVALLWFNESVSLVQGIGYALILVALVLFNYAAMVKRRAAQTF
jgi:chloramphenicol-sensitive protein RarD